MDFPVGMLNLGYSCIFASLGFYGQLTYKGMPMRVLLWDTVHTLRLYQHSLAHINRCKSRDWGEYGKLLQQHGCYWVCIAELVV